MESSQLLTSGVDKIEEIKKTLLELQGHQAAAQNQGREEDRLEKEIYELEKAMNDEIALTLKKRKQEIDKTFDDQLDKIKTRSKRLKDKRDKRKSQKMSERIKEETAALTEENVRLKVEAKTIVKQKKIPKICNTKYFFSLYSPKFIEDFFSILLTLGVTLFAIPCSIYFFILKEEKMMYLVLIYIITVVVFGGIYILGNRIKDNYSDGLKELGLLRSKRRINEKQIKVIKRAIKKDRDESEYGLESFDEELDKLRKEEDEIAGHKKEALLVFDQSTSQIISGEIRGRYDEQLQQRKNDHRKSLDELSKTQEIIKALTLKIANEYEPYLWKDLISIERLEMLSNIIKSGDATTISEAATTYRQSLNQK